MSTYLLRHMAARLKNAQIRANDLAELLSDQGLHQESVTVKSYGNGYERLYKALMKRADETRDNRGALRRSE